MRTSFTKHNFQDTVDVYWRCGATIKLHVTISKADLGLLHTSKVEQ